MQNDDKGTEKKPVDKRTGVYVISVALLTVLLYLLYIEPMMAYYYYLQQTEAFQVRSISSQGSEVYFEWGEDLTVSEIQALNDGNAIFVYDDTHQLTEIRGQFTEYVVKTQTDAVNALASVRGLFGIESPEFHISEVDRSSRFAFYTVQQLYCGIPVHGGVFNVVANEDGVAMSVAGEYVPTVDVNITPKVTVFAAIKAALGSESTMDVRTVDLLIVQNTLYWRVVHIASADGVEHTDEVERTTLVNAESGQVFYTGDGTDIFSQ